MSNKLLDDLKSNPNVWECPTCFNDKFPFQETDDIDIFMDSETEIVDVKVKLANLFLLQLVTITN